MRATRGAWPALVVAALAFIALGAPSARGAGSGARAFTGVRLFDGSGKLVEGATLVVNDGRVVAAGAGVAVPQDAERVDLGGRFVMPGLVSAHGHVGATKGLRSGPELYSRENVLDQLRLYARYGVTTVTSLGDDREEGFRVRDEQDVPTLDRARLHVAGPVVDAMTPDAARTQVAAVAAMKPDWVKIRVDDTLGTTKKMPPEVYRTVIEEAHKRGLRVAAHLFYLADAKDLVASGVDMIAHSVRDAPIDAAFAADLARRQLCTCPTLMREVSAFVYADEPAFFSDPFFQKEADPAVIAELQQARAARARARESRDGPLSGSAQDREREPQDARRRRGKGRLRHGHGPARALPGVLRARGAGPDGRGRPHADAGARRGHERHREMPGPARRRPARARRLGRLPGAAR